MGKTRSPHTADGDDFRFRAGRWSLDLCSTLLWRHRDPVDLLSQHDDLVRWLREATVTADPVDVNDDQLATARALRETAYRLFRARVSDEPLDADDIATVNQIAARPSRFPQLTRSGHVRWHADTDGALAAVAGDCIELLTGPLAERLRECAAPDCAFLFVDTSRPGTRRWCAQNRCGNRQHVREHRARASLRDTGAR